jgi:OmpA-OmpF porin, OOP family
MRWVWALLACTTTAAALASPAVGAAPGPDDLPDPSDESLVQSVTQISTEGSVHLIPLGGITPIDTSGAVADLVVRSQDGDQTVVTIATDLLFDFGSAELDSVGEDTVRTAVVDAPQGATIQVTGHTDAISGDEVNIPLSLSRAQTVAAVIAQARPDLSIQVAGAGSSEPVASETHADGTDDPVGRAANRRVEIRYGG